MAERSQDFGESFSLLLHGGDSKFLWNFPKFLNILEDLFPFTVYIKPQILTSLSIRWVATNPQKHHHDKQPHSCLAYICVPQGFPNSLKLPYSLRMKVNILNNLVNFELIIKCSNYYLIWNELLVYCMENFNHKKLHSWTRGVRRIRNGKLQYLP